MLKRVFVTALAGLFLAAAVHPVIAEEKKPTPQQQKMKDCAVKWKDEKAKTNAKGRAAYNKFMSTCLKK